MDYNKLKDLSLTSYLDVGTNTAQFYTELIKIFPNIYCEFVEPNPRCSQKIAKRFKNIVTHHVGLGETIDSLKLYINKYKGTSKGASFIRDDKIEVNEIIVHIKTLDSIAQDKKFDLIKIDVEGFELKVLKGGEKTLSQTKYLLIEMDTDSQIVEWLESRSFSLIDVIGHHYYNKQLIKIDGLFERNSTISKFDIKTIK